MKQNMERRHAFFQFVVRRPSIQDTRVFGQLHRGSPIVDEIDPHRAAFA